MRIFRLVSFIALSVFVFLHLNAQISYRLGNVSAEGINEYKCFQEGKETVTTYLSNDGKTAIIDKPSGTDVTYALNCDTVYQNMLNIVLRTSTTDGVQVAVLSEDGKKLYLKNPMPPLKFNSWVVLEKVSEKIWEFSSPQYIGSKKGMFDPKPTDYWLGVYEKADQNNEETISYKLSSKKLQLVEDTDGILRQADTKLMLGFGHSDTNPVWTGFGMINFKYEKVPDVVSLPDDAVVKSYNVFHSNIKQPLDADFLKIARKGNDVYLGGFRGVPDGWVKGTLDIKSQTLTIPDNQIMAKDTNTLLFVRFQTVKYGVDTIDGETVITNKKIPHVELKWNIIENSFVSKNDSNGFFYWNRGVYYYKNPRIRPQENPSDQVFIPMKPEVVSVSDWDTANKFRQIICVISPRNASDDKALNKGNMFWRVYLNDSSEPYMFPPEQTNLKTPVSEIPFGFNAGNFDFMYSYGTLHYFFLRVENLNKFGVQTVYRIDDKEQVSEIAYHKLTDSAPEISASNTDILREEYFDLMGNRVSGDFKGIRIKKQVMSNGDVKVSKEFVR